MGTAVYWSRCLREIETTGGELTEALQKTFPPNWSSLHALQKTFPPNWSSFHTLDVSSDIDSDDELDIVSDDDDMEFASRINGDETMTRIV
ncbi:hypothetical protein ACFX2A_028756 [Malus domestica]